MTVVTAGPQFILTVEYRSESKVKSFEDFNSINALGFFLTSEMQYHPELLALLFNMSEKH